MTSVSLTFRPHALRAVVVACAVAVLALVGALPAFAHAALVRSSPTAGSTLTAVPPEVALTFNEDINKQFVTVTVKSGGTTASTGKAEVEGPTVYQPLDPTIPSGTYTVAYRVTSADGHPVSGSYTFTYSPSGGGEGEGSPTGSASSPAAPSPTSSATATPSSTASPTTPPPANTSSSETTATTPTSSTSEPSTTSTEPTYPESTSTTSAAEPSSPTTTPATGGETSGSEDGLPWWAWALVALGGAVLIGGLVALFRGRRDGYDDEYDLRDPDDGDLR